MKQAAPRRAGETRLRRLSGVAFPCALACALASGGAADGLRAQEPRERADTAAAAADTLPPSLEYRLHPLAPEPVDAPAVRDRDSAEAAPTRRVVQGPRFTWVAEEADAAGSAPDDAELILDRGVPLLPGPGPLLVRGWPSPTEPVLVDTLSVHLTRGTRDRAVAGRPAAHWELDAVVAWTDTVRASGRRARITGDVWVLPDLPFTWGPFGADRRSIPTLLPALRDTLTAELAPLGLVGRADLRLEFAMRLAASDLPAPTARTAFEIFDLRVDSPGSGSGPAADREPPGSVVDRGIIVALERLQRDYARRTCRDAADGELPAIMRARVDPALWPPLVSFLAQRCRR